MTADVVRNVTIKLRVHQEPYVVRTPDITPVEATTKRIEANYKATFRRISDEHYRTLHTVQTPNVDVVRGTTLVQSGEGLKMAGEGAFHVARGIALMNIESEEELALVVKKIAYYQGMFDIYKGGLDVVKGVSAATKAMALAHASASVAAGIQAGTVGNLTVTMIAAKGAALGLWNAVTGPVGMAVIGTTAAVGLGYLAWNKYAGSVDTAKEKLLEQARQLYAVRDAQDRVTASVRNFDRLAIIADAAKMRRDHEFTDAALTNRQKLARIEADARKHREDSILDILRMTQKNPNQSPGFAIGARGGNDAKDYRDLTINSSAYLDTIKRVSGVVQAIGDKDQRLALQTNLTSQAERESKVAKERLTTLGEEHDKLKQLLQTERDRQKAAEDRLQALKLANMSNVEKIGAMDPLERAKLQEAAKELKANNGDASKLSPWHQEILTKSGLATGAISRLNLDRGIAAGGEQLLRDLGTNNITPIEAAQGIGPEGRDKGQLFKTQLNQSKFTQGHFEDELQAIVAQKKANDQQFLKLFDQLTDRSVLMEAIKNAVADKKLSDERFNEDLEKLKGLTDQERSRARASAMQRRGYQG